MTVRLFRHLNIFQCLFLSVVFFTSCQEKYKRNKSHSEVSFESIAKGEELAARYCQTCHLLPDPALVNSASWENGVLPNMAPRLGIFYYNFRQYPSSRHDRFVPDNFYPPQPLLSNEEWQHVIDYYAATSPDEMPGQKRDYPISNDFSLFKPEFPGNLYSNSTTSYIHVDTGSETHRIIISDAIEKATFFLDKNLKMADSIHHAGPVVDIDFEDKKMVACDIGILNPNNGRFGKAVAFITGADGRYEEESHPLFDSLQRPVQITAADFNADGKEDYLVCEFGFVTGELSWMENLGGEKFARHVLRPLPGAIKAYITDYNHDGLPDIWVLFAQGDESIILFTNRGNGNFSQQQLLRFPPSYGSSYFELDDFNKDGFPDIVYTCGDNADYSAILKPYHGVYIFMNDKTNHFVRKFFFPINGCYKAIAKDFDGDGDLDIAAISFFADYTHQPEEGFIYLKNNGNFNFKPYSIKETEKGRWLTMDAGDIDGDGKPDIILGNFSIGPVLNRPATNWKQAPFLVLKNMSK